MTAATGIITTVAGGALNNYGDGGLAVNAGITGAVSFTIDRSGNIYIGSSGNQNKVCS